jgi:hypothetical protein
MNENHVEPAYRAISIIALIQAAVVAGGTLFVTAMLKAHGFRDGVPDTFFRENALFVRRFGFTILLFPVAWALAAICAARAATSAWIQLAIYIFGLAAILFGIYNYVFLGFNPEIL